ncbi:hypothetical protein D3C85_1015310 [compost metagenome]
MGEQEGGEDRQAVRVFRAVQRGAQRRRRSGRIATAAQIAGHKGVEPLGLMYHEPASDDRAQRHQSRRD